MSMPKVVFAFNNTEIPIECSKEEKMKDICQKFATKINSNLDSFIFLNEKKQVNLDSTFKDQANSTDEMKLIVYKKEDNGFICPKCGEKIKLNPEIIEKIILSNVDILDNLIGTKLIIDDIIKTSSINLVYAQLKNISTILNTVNQDIQKNNEKLKSIINYKSTINTNINNMLLDENAPIISNNSQNKNIIKGVIELESNDINNSVILFKSDYNYEIDLYLNNKKAKMIKDNGSWKIDYNFNKEEKYKFTMVFNDTVIDMEEFFGKSSYLISLDLTDFDSSNVTNMRILFNKCKRLKEIKGIEKLNTKNVIDMEGMFQYCTELDYLDISNFDTSKVESMAFMFNHCEKLKELKGLNKFITNNVTTTEGMFQSCFSIEYLDLSNFDTSNVIIMDYMFEECSRLKGIKGLNKLITSKVVSMEGLFQLCTLLKYVDLSNFDTSNVTNMGYMFNKCKKLKEIKGMNHFNTANLKSTFAMFQICTELEHVDLSNFDTSNITNMSFMFNQCNRIKEIKGINQFITNKVKTFEAMFQGCYDLEYLDLSNFDTSNVTNMEFMFNKCNKLKYLNLLNFGTVDKNKNMLSFKQKDKCEFISNNEDLHNLFNSDY